MYLPRLRKISDAIHEIRRFDGECALSAFFIHQLIRKGKISSLLYGDALLVNLDELFAFFLTSKSDGEYIPAQALPEGRSMLTSGEIFRLFRADDPGTVIRKPNLRRFVLQQDLPYTVLNGKWLIDFPSLLSALNPSGFHRRFDKPPKLRLHDDAVFDFKRLHPHLHVTLQTIEEQFHSPEVFSVQNGKRRIVNYDELETAVIRAAAPFAKDFSDTHISAKKSFVRYNKFYKGKYTFSFKCSVVEYLLQYNLSYRDIVIRFWGTLSPKKIASRVRLVKQWENDYKKYGRNGLLPP